MEQPDDDGPGRRRSGDEHAAPGPGGHGSITEGVRIAAVEAAVAAGLAPSTTRAAGSLRQPDQRPTEHGAGDGEPGASGSLPAGGFSSLAGRLPGRATGEPGERSAAAYAGEAAGWHEPTGAYGLPDWSDPPTGQVPRVLLDEPLPGADPAELVGHGHGPSWREVGSDWDDDDDLSFLAEAPTEQAGGRLPTESDHPFEFSFAELELDAPAGHDAPPGGRLSASRADGSSAPDPGEVDELEGWSGSDEDAAWSELLSQRVADDAASSLAALGPETRRRHASRGRFGRGRPGLRAPARRYVPIPREPGCDSERGDVSGGVPATVVPGAAAVAAAAGTTDPGDADEPARGTSLSPAGHVADPAALSTPAEATGDGLLAAAGSPSRLRRGGRNPVQAVLTGCVAGGVALAAFLTGPLPTLVLVAVVVTLGSGEALAALRRSGFRPASPVALAASPAMMIAAYDGGLATVPTVFAATVVLVFVWFLTIGSRRATAADLGVTTLVVSWVGVLGAFAGALLAPATFADRHGLAVLVAAVLLAVGNDVGAYAVGSRLGRHKLAPAVSPGKSWEGAAGGTLLTLVLAALVVARIHPLDLERALLLGAVVCVLAPLGDLAESLLKRDLGLKDMGDLLPAHGGVLDRIDSLLLVLPAAYCLAVAWHLG